MRFDSFVRHWNFKMNWLAISQFRNVLSLRTMRKVWTGSRISMNSLSSTFVFIARTHWRRSDKNRVVENSFKQISFIFFCCFASKSHRQYKVNQLAQHIRFLIKSIVLIVNDYKFSFYIRCTSQHNVVNTKWQKYAPFEMRTATAAVIIRRGLYLIIFGCN